jgi:predicted SAM-dependent methyltransferase
VSPGLTSALKQLYREIRVAWAVRSAHANLQKLRDRSELKVQLGCGFDLRPGWINIDICVRDTTSIEPTAIYINHDLRRGLPLAPNCCALIYSSHLFEHLDEETGTSLMRDCFRALRPGGVFRIVLPDMAKIFKAYLEKDARFFHLLEDYRLIGEPTGERSMADYVNYAVYQFGEHKCIYDYEKLDRILSSIGFTSVALSTFTEEFDAANDLRRAYSFYAEAKK